MYFLDVWMSFIVQIKGSTHTCMRLYTLLSVYDPGNSLITQGRYVDYHSCVLPPEGIHQEQMSLSL